MTLVVFLNAVLHSMISPLKIVEIPIKEIIEMFERVVDKSNGAVDVHC